MLVDLPAKKAPLYLPEYRPTSFIGRTAHLQQLAEILTPEPARFMLCGEPGIGKSTLARRFAWKAQADFDAVIFQHCGRRSVDEITSELVDHLNLDVKTLSPEMQRKEALRWLSNRRALLILDDVWWGDVKTLIPGPAASVLCTSRQRGFDGFVSIPKAFPS